MTRFAIAAFLAISAGRAEQARVEPILDLERGGWTPVLSPDGKYVAFTSFSDTGGAVAIVSARDGKPANLAFREVSFAPSWSPDSRFIAYVLHRGKDHTAVVVRDPQTTVDRELGRVDSDTTGEIAWSPDSRSLAFVAPGRNAVVYNLEGGRMIRKVPLGDVRNFAISPDWKRLAYAVGGWIYVSDFTPDFASRGVKVAEESHPIGRIFWMPDLKTILYQFPSTGAGSAYRKAGLGRRPSAVFETANRLDINQILADGAAIGEEWIQKNGNLHWATTEVTYSPDKKTKAYITTRWTGKQELHISNRDGSHDRLIAAESKCEAPPFRKPYYLERLEWSPDSAFLVFRCSCTLPAKANTGSHVATGYLAPVNGGPLRQQPSYFDVVKTERIVPDQRQDRHRLVRVLLPD